MSARNLLLLPLLMGLLGGFCPLASATHLRGGEITYRTDAANPLKVFGEVTLYLSTQSSVGEPSISVNMGDGTQIRASYILELDLPLPGQTLKRVWRLEHIYSAPGSYRISYVGINRNEGIINMANSFQQTLFVYTDLNLSPQGGSHHSPHLLAPPIMRAIQGQPFHHNLTAYDPDGDSLAYDLIVPRSADSSSGQVLPSLVPGYAYPSLFSINAQTGDILWQQAGAYGDLTLVGEFAVAVRITKYRNAQVLSRLVRDFQIIVVPSSFQPPALSITNREALRISPENTLEAPLRQPLEIQLKVSKEGADSVRLRAYGELFLEASSRPSFTATQEQESVRGLFLFSPQPSHLRSLPYLVTYRATYFYANQPNLPVQKDLTVVLYVTRQTITGLTNHEDRPQQVHLYPNPVQDEFLVEVPDTQERQLVLYSLDGKEVLRQMLLFPQTRIRRPSHLKSGMYRYTLSGPSHSARAGKVVLQ